MTVLASALALGCGLAVSTPAFAQAPEETGRPVDEVMQSYIREALASNLALQNQTLQVDSARYALRAARAHFLPELSLNARYTRAQGGREFTIPLTQIVDPAYATLNQLLIAGGGTARFAALPDQNLPLQLPTEQDSRLQLRQPVYAPALPAALAAARDTAQASELGREALARELRRDVQLAYLGWLRADASVTIVAAGRDVLEENQRVAQSLFEHGRVTKDQVLRARAELLEVAQQQQQSIDAREQARRYVNFLLNRPLADALEHAVVPEAPSAPAAPAEDERSQALASRPELAQNEHAAAAAAAQMRVAGAALKPNIALGVDFGSEGTRYGIGSGYNFVSGSLVLSWTLFDGGARAAAVGQARAVAHQLANQHAELEQRVALEVAGALEALESTRAALDTARERAEAARESFRIASRKRDEGLLSQVEFLDARTTLTSAELNLNMTRFELLQRRAELEFATASTPLPTPGVTP